MDEITQSVRGYLRIFFRRKWLFLIPAFIGLIVGICASILLPRSYKASSTVLVQEGKTDNPLFNNLAVSSTMNQRTQAIKETILGWDSLVTLIKRLKLDEKLKDNKEFEELVAKLRKEIDIQLRNGNILELAYISDSPQKSQGVIQNVLDIFIERNVSVQNKETADAIMFIEEQLHVYKGKIKSSEIADLKDKLNVLLIDSTEEHPLVKQLRDQINNKMAELQKENLEYTEDVRLNETASPMVEQIKKTLDSISVEKVTPTPAATPEGETGMYKVMLLDKLDKVMARDAGVNEGIYNALLQRLETAKITQRLQSSKEGTKYTVLDPPRLPLEPVSPNVIMVVVGCMVLGMGVGGALLFLTEFMDKSFLDVEEASQYLGAPLLGAVSKIQTVELLEVEREKSQWRVFWMFSIGVLSIAFAVMLKAFLKP